MLELLSRQRQFLLYLAGGVASALIDVGLMQFLIYSGVDYVAATSVGFVAGLVFNYGYHATVTFTAPPSGRSMGRYLAVVAMNYLFTLGCVALSVHLVDMALVGKLLSLPLVAINGFILGKHWIFK
ncbi:GtrA family protein [Massilia soli]|uniref:GtrA family protein n=1 Tax=Massilia soli TaxID=2792854 RepID=A0ABS7STP1_9BURK|nr:GtrA family protein [Massilia soli]MBZ2209319.1 GtrA family protein [Massilia soli]